MAICIINKLIKNCDWNKLLPGQYIHNQVNLFKTTLLNFFQNFIPNKVILCDDKEPFWVIDEVRLLTKQRKLIFKTQRKVIILILAF